MPAIELTRDRRAHAVTGEDGALHFCIVHDGRNRAREVIHRISERLAWLVLWYRFFEFFGVVEKRNNVMTATTELKEVSLSIRMNDNAAARRHMSAVIQALNIPQAAPGPTDTITETPGEAEEGTSRP